MGLVCGLVVCVVLALGLWPFHAPRNDVTWLKPRGGVTFGRYGTIVGTGALRGGRSGAGSIEIWLQPDDETGSTFLSLSNPEKRVLLTLHQSLDDLVVNTRAARDWQFYVRDVFNLAARGNEPVFLSVISGKHGTKVFVQGVLAKSVPEFTIPGDAFAGMLIVGDSPRQSDSFQGKILGLAIYDTELDDAQVLRHYQSWTNNAEPDIGEDECNFALYLFKEGSGNLIYNSARAGSDLFIPNTYAVVDKLAFEPVWEEFDISLNYLKGNIKNIIGFIPVGFCFYAYFLVARPARRSALLTVIVGTVISVMIEVAQIFLPTRDSGTTDIIMNACGTWAGIALYRRTRPLVIARLPKLSWLLTPRS